ncbi:D-threo-aldose 1-dehydrogenase [Catenuloplanes nepalensis]|uniref:D-threo-aldose 1-dehydrogenase n=1 Tax=Catenuloplanes nepalensis TaxID=587533 RepID=A0ABT9N966_9ACTN|nr:aldo/keto reductase [Catenuloplanes nepalensis]MDP9799776.1 D-threo-aldose 1-dehydrogenase [Catenuloplanes nepalensis]
MDPAARIRLGGSDVLVTRLGLGLAPIGGLYAPVGDATATAVIDRAWQRGIRLFDTAPLYGHGLSERRTGAALRDKPRHQMVLSTKAGRLVVPGDAGDPTWTESSSRATFDVSAAGIRRSVSESLERLGLDRVDLLHLHDPDDHYLPALHEALPAMAELRKSGAVGAISIGMNQAPMLAAFIRATGAPGPDAVMVAGRYTLLDQSALDDLLPLAARRGISVLAAAPFNSGLLADPRPGARFDYAPAAHARLGQAIKIKDICRGYGVPLRAAALQFAFGHPAVAAVVCGARTPAEVDDNVAMTALPIPPELWTALKAENLLPAHVPTP